MKAYFCSMPAAQQRKACRQSVKNDMMLTVVGVHFLQKRKNKSFADGVLEVKAGSCTLYDEARHRNIL